MTPGTIAILDSREMLPMPGAGAVPAGAIVLLLWVSAEPTPWGAQPGLGLVGTRVIPFEDVNALGGGGDVVIAPPTEQKVQDRN